MAHVTLHHRGCTIVPPSTWGKQVPRVASQIHLDFVHPRLEARGRPFPRSLRFRSGLNLRVRRPMTWGPPGQQSPLQTPHGRPGVQGIFPTSRGQTPHGWPMVHHTRRLVSQSHGVVAWRFLSPHFPCSDLFKTPRCPVPLCHIPSAAHSPRPVVSRSQGAVARPLPHPFPGAVASSDPSSRLYTPAGCQQPCGSGLLRVDRLVLLARVAPIPSLFLSHVLRSPDQPRLIESGTSGHISHGKALLAYQGNGTRTQRR